MKFSIVTPSFNSEKYIRETIESVLSQKGDFEIEYIVADGASTDSTLQILEEYESKIKSGTFIAPSRKVRMSHTSQKDNGMYDALNRGFSLATGDILAWINADDIYLPGAFAAIHDVFLSFKDIEWLKGKTVFMDEDGKRIGASPCFLFNQEWIQKGIYGRNAYFINQDSVFWRKSLFEKVSPITRQLRYAGDYELWTKFANLTKLWALDTEVSAFRHREGQLSANEAAYQNEQRMISKDRSFTTLKVKTFFFIKNTFGNSWEWLFLKLYPLVFWKRERQYLRIENGAPVIKKASSYRVT